MLECVHTVSATALQRVAGMRVCVEAYSLAPFPRAARCMMTCIYYSTYPPVYMNRNSDEYARAPTHARGRLHYYSNCTGAAGVHVYTQPYSTCVHPGTTGTALRVHVLASRGSQFLYLLIVR